MRFRGSLNGVSTPLSLGKDCGESCELPCQGCQTCDDRLSAIVQSDSSTASRRTPIDTVKRLHERAAVPALIDWTALT